MTAVQKEALGKLFAYEVDYAFDKSLLPPQLPKAVGASLVAAGLAQEVETTLPGRFPVRVDGYVLTDKGHMIYCMECCDESEETP